MATSLAGVTPLLLCAAPASADLDWDAVAQCESGGDWQIDTHNGYDGGLQFTRSTWLSAGGQQYASEAHQATKQEQIAVAQRVLATQGPGAWPVCGARSHRYRDQSWSSGASRSYRRHDQTTYRQTRYHWYNTRQYTGQTWQGYGSPGSTNRDWGGTSTWRTRSAQIQPQRSRYRTRVLTTSAQTVATVPVHLRAVPEFLAQRKYTMGPVALPLPKTYEVRPGDDLVLIAANKQLSWQALYARNRVIIGADPNLIVPGLRLVVG